MQENDLQGDRSEPPGRCLQRAGFQERTCMNREKSSKNAVTIRSFLENERHCQKTSELYKNIWILRKIADTQMAIFPLHSPRGSGRIPLVAAREVKTFPEAAGHKWRTGRRLAAGLKNFQKKCLTKITRFVILYRLSLRARAWEDTGRCQAAPRKAPLKSNIWQLNRNATLKISFRS